MDEYVPDLPHDLPPGVSWPYNPFEGTSSTDTESIEERMLELESQSEGGWAEEERHNFSLVRVPINFLKEVQLQVRLWPGSTFSCNNSQSAIFLHFASCGPSGVRCCANNCKSLYLSIVHFLQALWIMLPCCHTS
jgi:hypothetical protein